MEKGPSRWLIAALLVVGSLVCYLALSVDSPDSTSPIAAVADRSSNSGRRPDPTRATPGLPVKPLPPPMAAAMPSPPRLNHEKSPGVVEILYRWTSRHADERALDAINATSAERAAAVEIADWHEFARKELEESLESGGMSVDEWFQKLNALEEERRARERRLFGPWRSEQLHRERDAVWMDAIDSFLRPAAQESLEEIGIPGHVLDPGSIRPANGDDVSL